MILAMVDATTWIALAHGRPPKPPRRRRRPTRIAKTPLPPPAAPDSRVLAVLAAESLLYDALLVAVVASALLVSR